MPEVTKIGYFLTDLIKKVDFWGDTVYMQPYNLCGELYSRMQCGTRLSQKKSRHSRTLNVELGSSSNTRPATQVRLTGGRTPDLRHRSGWVMVKQSNTQPATQVRLSGGGTPDLRHRSGWVMVKQSNTRPATQVRLSGGGTPDPRHRSGGGTPDPLHRSGSQRTSHRRRSTRRDDLDRCRATDIRDPPLSHTSSSHHPSLVDPRDGIVL